MEDARYRGLMQLQDRVRAAGDELGPVMEAVVGEFSVMPQATGIVVELRDADQLYYAAASGTSAHLVGLRLDLTSSLSGLSILTGETLSCKDCETDPRVNLAACRAVGLRSMIVIPIPHRGQTVGVLKYYSDRVDAFTEDDILLAHLIVGPIAIGFSMAAEGDALRLKRELETVIAVKQQLIGTVSHELRTPLASINGALSMLESGTAGELPDKAGRLIAISRRNTLRLQSLVDDLLELERLSAQDARLEVQPVDIAALLREAAEQSEPFASQLGVSLEVEIADATPAVLLHPARMMQALTNLISNAVKYSPEGGMVSISARPADQGWVAVRVEDEGPGVPADFHRRLFQPFSQATDTRDRHNLPSSGLGLAITRRIVEAMGGSVRLDEGYADGAAFEIRLRASDSKAIAA